MKTMRVQLTLTEPMLGTTPGDPELMSRFVAAKAPDSEREDEENEAHAENADASEELERATTVFLRDGNGKPFVWNYQIEGFFKDACGMLRRVKGTQSSKLKAYKKFIDGLLFVLERRIPLELPENGEIVEIERPLRAQTPKGERVALARSESVPAGTKLSFTIRLLDETLEDYLHEWFDYGELRGLGAWRNSGMGRFIWEEVNGDA